MSSDKATPTDGEIVQAVLSGQRERFGEIVRRYYVPLLRVAGSRLGPSIAAEDVVQESFLSALKSLHTYNSQYSFRTWLWTIALNQCRRFYAKHQKRSGQPWNDQGSSLEPADQIDQRHVHPLTRILSQERRDLLHQLLDQLPQVQADALRLRFFGHLKFQEIADTMQCSLSTAKHRVRTGLQQMSVVLGKSIDTDSPVEIKHEL